MGPSVFHISNVEEKIARCESECNELLRDTQSRIAVPVTPARDLSVFDRRQMPAKGGLQSPEGQARLLHNLANVELQAMELGLRTLHEYPEAPAKFREELASIVRDESRHLGLCIRGLRDLGFEWGNWPVHMILWNTVTREDSLLDRVFIVHGYLEASGLDSGEQLLNRFSGVINRAPRDIVKIISDEELGHVQFGVRWYRELCRREGLDPADDFRERTERLSARLPSRAPEISEKARLAAGFDKKDIDFMRQFAERKIREAHEGLGQPQH